MKQFEISRVRVNLTADALGIASALGLEEVGDRTTVRTSKIESVDALRPAFVVKEIQLAEAPAAPISQLGKFKVARSETDTARLAELSYSNDERVWVHRFPDYFVLSWTTAMEGPALGELFEADLKGLDDIPSEAAFSTLEEDGIAVAPIDLSKALLDHPDTTWFRVNLERESFVWLAPQGLGHNNLKKFAVISDVFDLRLMMALIDKTGSMLIRSTLHSLVTEVASIGRSSGIEIRKPSMLARFLLS